MAEICLKGLTEKNVNALAARLGEGLTPSILLLKGEMGSGKTVFSKAFAAGAGSLDETSSPTYTIVSAYDSPRGRIYHFDLYRISDIDELYAIGFDDYLDEERSFLIMEWPEIAELESEPSYTDRLATLEFTKDDPLHRTIHINGSDQKLHEIRTLLGL